MDRLIALLGRARPRTRRGEDADRIEHWWSLSPEALAARLRTTPTGLSSVEAELRLREHGPNEIVAQRAPSLLSVIRGQLASPLLLLLLFAAGVSMLTGEWVDAIIVLLIIVASVGVGASREHHAHTAVAALRARIHTKTTVVRDGKPTAVPAREVVKGDVVALEAGSLIPADGVLLEATDFFVNEAVLTGESFPVEKRPGLAAEGAPLRERTHCVFGGTNVRSGTARALIVAAGRATQFGAIAGRLALRAPETEFDRGVRRFGLLLTSAMGVMVLVVFAGNVILGRPPVETLLFSIALAVGLSPELLPAILSVNLARGAQMMARQGVLVRRLNAIEDLGSMDVLCTDKTGTLTEGVVRLDGAWDARGAPSQEVLEVAARNAALETGLANPLDDAIVAAHQPELSGVEKLGEIPYDFVRKRLSVIVREQGRVRMLIKGAFAHVLEACSTGADGAPLDAEARAALERRFDEWSQQGTRVLAVATRELDERARYSREDERELRFMGFLTFLDRPKAGVAATLSELRALGVNVKLITGDARAVAQHVATQVGMRPELVLTGEELDRLHDEALWHAAERTELFVEVDPNQKERIISALRKTGHVVGFLGDGVNDAPAMHAADASLSVDDAVDVAREAADFVLLERDLDVIRRGITEGRTTFANTLKYVLTTTSANLGNMVSMAIASLFLPFLPLTAGQVLLNNFLSDVPALGIAGDRVDADLVDRPRRWDMRFILRFMVEFGVLSSLFDLLTFAALLYLFQASEAAFRTGWFIESLLTELVIALVVRTRKRSWQSRPGRVLVGSTLAVVVLTFVIPWLPGAAVLGFVPLPVSLILSIVGVTALYVVAAELLKAGVANRGR